MSERTRLVRRPRPAPAFEPTRAPISAPPGRVGVELPSLVLACHAACGERARALLDGLASAFREEAREVLRRIQEAEPMARRRAMSLAFGVRSDADERLSLLAHEASHPLRAEILSQLPREHRPAFPSGVPASQRADRCVLARPLAARLMAEAMR